MNVKKIIAGLLSAFLFIQGTVFAYSAETNFWKERNKAMNHETRDNPPSHNSDPVTQLASLPTTSGMALPFSHSALTDLGISSGLSHTLKKNLTQSRVPAWIQDSVAPYATIQQVSNPPFALRATGGKPKTILLVQDIHLHTQAQEN